MLNTLTDLIIEYESGILSDKNTIKLFSKLVKSGQVNFLQGHYGRTAKNLIVAGYIDVNGNVLKEI